MNPTAKSSFELEIESELLSDSTYADSLLTLSGDEAVRTAIIATLGQSTNEGCLAILDQYTYEASRVKGRSAAQAREVNGEELETAEERYLRPNGEYYYPRPWGSFIDVAVLRRARELEKSALFLGEPGTGKTALAEGAFGDELITMLGTGDTELSDFIGGYVQGDTPGSFVWVDGPLIRAMTEGKPLLIDEIGVIDPKALTGLYGAMDGRKELVITANPERGIIKAAEGFYVLAATNPNAPGVRMSEALLSRFGIQVEITTDFSLALRLGVPKLFVGAAQNLNKRKLLGEIYWAPQFRELLYARDLNREFGQNFALANLLASAPEGDRPIVAEVLSQTLGEKVLPAQI